ncbi:MAG: phage minor head protein [Pseudomonadota bacterium]|nr:phage minor head protein [Pseudomonadota bacterium]
MADIRTAYAPFDAQARYFQRKVNVPTMHWQDLMHGDHAHGFMVAGLTRMDVLDDIRQAMQAVMDEGLTLKDFQERFEAAVKGRWEGFTGSDTPERRAWRAKVIYQTNLRTSYMAGRWEQLQKFPYLRYQHNTTRHPRKDHQEWDGRIIARNDPWWNTHYPPNGWGCRCSVTGVSEAGKRIAERNGATFDAPPPGDPKQEPPPEWAYHVGRESRSMAAAQRFGEKVMNLPPAWRDRVLDDAQQRSVNWFAGEWPRWVDAIVEQNLTGADMRAVQQRGAPVAYIPSEVVRAMESGKGSSLQYQPRERSFVPATPKSALIVGGDAFLGHNVRDLPPTSQTQLRAEKLKVLLEVPEKLASKDTAWLIDKTDNNALIAVWPDLTGLYWKVIIRDVRRKMSRTQVSGYRLIGLERQSRDQLQGHILLTGKL